MDTKLTPDAPPPQIRMAEAHSEEDRLRRINRWLIGTVVVLVLAVAGLAVALIAEVGAEEGRQTTSSAVPSSSATADTTTTLEGSWTGTASAFAWDFWAVPFDAKGPTIREFSIGVTLRAGCTEGELCGGEQFVVSEGGATCTAALIFSNVTTEGALVLDESSVYGECGREGYVVLTSEGDELLYRWNDASGVTHSQTFTLQPVDATP